MSTIVQEGWRWCKKCQCMWFPNGAGHCHAGGGHVEEGSAAYRLHGSSSTPVAPSDYNAQTGWRWCKKCLILNYGGATGVCPAGGAHDNSASYDYAISGNASSNLSGTQGGWSWCKKCQSLHFGGNVSNSRCHSGGSHDTTGSYNYQILADFSLAEKKKKEELEHRHHHEMEEKKRQEELERKIRHEMEEKKRKEELEAKIRRDMEEQRRREEEERRRREEEERRRREEEERRRREEEERRRREEEERKMNSVPYLKELIQELKKEVAKLKADLHDEQVKRITAEVKLEKYEKRS